MLMLLPEIEFRRRQGGLSQAKLAAMVGRSQGNWQTLSEAAHRAFQQRVALEAGPVLSTDLL
jgi:hypothetical protein